jgi:hypothetical protein
MDGREAFHLRAEGLDRVVSQPGDEHAFTLRSASMWVDTEHYVTLRLSILMEALDPNRGGERERALAVAARMSRCVDPAHSTA